MQGETLIAAAGVALYEGDIRRASRWLAAASAPGGVFTGPLGWMLYQRYIPQVRGFLPPDEARALRDEGRALSRAAALDEVARWTEA